MKKTITIILMLCISIFTIKAQNVVPNNGFETWTDSITAESWNSSIALTLGFFNVSYQGAHTSADAHTGDAAMLLKTQNVQIVQSFTVPGVCQLGTFDTDSITAMATLYLQGNTEGINPFNMLKGGVPFTNIPTEVKAWVKFAPAAGTPDTMGIHVLAGKHTASGDVLIAQGSYTNYETISDYTEISVPVELLVEGETPDYLNIIICNANDFNCGNSQLWVDDITVESEVGIQAINQLHFNIAPNPTQDMLNIRLENNEPFTAGLYDLNGKKVMESTDCQQQLQWDVHQLSAGTYIVKIEQGRHLSTRKVVIQ